MLASHRFENNFFKTWHQYRVPNKEDNNNHYEKDTLENGLPNKNTGLGDSKIIIDPSTKTISQTGEGYAPDTIAPDAEY